LPVESHQRKLIEMTSPATPAEPRTAHRQTMPRAVARALADPLRWRIVELLASEQVCVNHLAAELEAPQPPPRLPKPKGAS
jgi:hypothetical protein